MEQKHLLLEQGNSFLTEGGFNAFKVEEWREVVESDSFNIVEYEQLLQYFSVSAFKTQTGFSSIAPPRFLASLEKEIYKVLSDDKNKGKANLLTSAVISGLSATVASALNIDPFIVGGFSNLIILSVMRVGIGAWCGHYEEKMKHINRERSSDDK